MNRKCGLNSESVSPGVRLTAALQERKQHRMILITAVTLSFIIQTREELHTLNTHKTAVYNTSKLKTIQADIWWSVIFQACNETLLTTGKVARPTPATPSTQHSSDRYLMNNGHWLNICENICKCEKLYTLAYMYLSCRPSLRKWQPMVSRLREAGVHNTHAL